MADKPSYLGLLNAIAVGEARGHRLLSTWAATTPSTELAHDLQVVALREQEHAAAFAKRICELGFNVRDREDPGFEERLEAAGSKLPDRKKFKKVLGISRKRLQEERDDDIFKHFFDDDTIDIQTGALLGRFIAEERDSGRRLRAAFEALVADADSTPADDLEEICARLDALTATIESLKDRANG
jgi:hypothetical protein